MPCTSEWKFQCLEYSTKDQGGSRESSTGVSLMDLVTSLFHNDPLLHGIAFWICRSSAKQVG